MGMDPIDYKNRHRYYCSTCNEELFHDEEGYSIKYCSDGIDFGECDDCKDKTPEIEQHELIIDLFSSLDMNFGMTE